MPSTRQRRLLATYRAVVMASESATGCSVICVLSHVTSRAGAAHGVRVADVEAQHDVRAVFGTVNVSVDRFVAPRFTVGPETWLR